jgi:hypothetical protein
MSLVRHGLAGLAAALAAGSVHAEGFDRTEREHLLGQIAGTIEAKYVYPDAATAAAAEVRRWIRDPQVMDAPDQRAFAAVLTARLRARDRHFRVSWAPKAAAAPSGAQGPGPDGAGPDPKALFAFLNGGFERVERLPGNIGYVTIRGFLPLGETANDAAPSATRRAAVAALALVEGTDAVIIDLRRNRGGDPATVNFILSHFFGDQPVLLNSFQHRDGAKAEPNYTLARLEGARRPTVPIFVLTSFLSASGAEEFAYDVQTHKRGLVVGQVTVGAANPGDDIALDDGFSIFVSTGAPVDPITGTNWEGVGVKPDVPTSFEDALPRAYELALAAAVKTGRPEFAGEARWELERAHAVNVGVTTPEPVKADYPGAYGDDIAVSLTGGELYMRRQKRPLQRLIPLGKDLFAPELDHLQRLRFERDAAGRVVKLAIEFPDDAPDEFVRR